MTNSRTQTISRNLLPEMNICAAELATWGVGPDVGVSIIITEVQARLINLPQVTTAKQYVTAISPFVKQNSYLPI